MTVYQLVVIRAQTMVVIHALHSNRTHMRRFFNYITIYKHNYK